MRIPAIASLLVLLAACTSSEPEDAVVGQELLRPTPQVSEEIRSYQTDPSRTGDCAQLSGEAMRECLDRAQYQPRNAEGLPDEPATGRQDPAQVDLDRAGQHRPPQTPARTDDPRDDRQ